MFKWFKNKWFLLFIGIVCLKVIDLRIPAPAYAKLFIYLGEKAESKQQTQKAVEDYLRAINYNKNSPRPYYKLAYLYEKIGDEKSKIKYFEKAFEMGSDIDRMTVYPYQRRDLDYARACHAVGVEYQKKGDLADAIRLFELSLNHYSPFPESSYQLGLIYSQLNDPDKTIYYYRELRGEAANDQLLQDMRTLVLKSHSNWVSLF
jgi:tetratricopeptide (TPR) repeat protein